MKYTNLNGTDILSSAVAIGTALFGTKIDVDTSFLLLDTFFEYGGNLIDTAHYYANWISDIHGLSEKTIGKWMKERNNRHDVIISTKGAHPRTDALHIPRLSREEILHDIDGSLLNLNTDYVDIYFLHRDDMNRPVGDIMETLAEILKSGKARSIGLSNWSIERIAEAKKYLEEKSYFDITASQIYFGIAYQNTDKIDPTTKYMDSKAYEYYSQQNMNLFSFSSQSGGYFFTKGENRNPIYDNEKSRAKYDLVYELSEKYNVSVAQVITGAISSNPDFSTIPIIGGITAEEIIDSVKGVDLKMEEADVLALLSRD